MKHILRSIFVALAAAAWLPAQADLNIFATVPEWAALAQELGGGEVRVYSATTAQQDPHRVEARPSLIAKARSADLVIATGAELEVGWLPLVIQQAANPKIRAGQPGYFEAASFVPLLGKPARLDRAEGDVHPAAIRTSRPIRATSPASRRSSRRAWRRSILHMRRSTAPGMRSSRRGGVPPSRAGRSRRLP